MRRTLTKCILFSLSFLLGAGLLQAQEQAKVSGTIVDQTGQPVIGATIQQVGNLSNIATSDLDGKFTLTLPQGAVLRFTYIGYTTIETAAYPNMQVVMEEDSQLLEEVVVLAYGGQQLRSKVTNSIAKVKEESLSTGLYSNPAQALSGAVAGLVVQQTSGNPGSTPTMILRGGTNLDGSGSPLVIVDGQIRSMSDLNPNDIESMEVMKDAGATAIYGARANNGVILVTTKKGKDGTSKIEFSAKIGLNYYNEGIYQFLGAGDYLTWMRTAYWRSSNIYQTKNGNMTGTTNLNSLGGAQPYGTGNRYFDNDGNVLDGNKNSAAVWSTMKYTDDLAFLLEKGWSKMKDPLATFSSAYDQEIIYKEYRLSDVSLRDPALSQDYNLNFSGGNDKGHYYAGLGYNYSNGTAIDNWYQRITFVINADYKIRKWLTSYSSINFADAKWYDLAATTTSSANYFSRLFSLPTTFRGVNEDGEYLIGTRGTGDSNPMVNQGKFVRNNNTDKFALNQAFKMDLATGLYLKLTAIWNFDMSKSESFNHDYISNVGPRYSTARSSSASEDRTLSQTYNAVLNYDLSINDAHNIAAMAGFEFYDAYNKGFSASGSGAPTDDFMDLSYTTTDEGARSIDSWHSRQRIMSSFGRLNYDYLGKYLISGVVRYDGYSKLAAANRWGFFPGVSAGWILSKEDFMASTSDVISFAKLRASYGANGNVSSIGNYYVQGAYSSSKYGGDTGFLLSTLPNPGLLWERSRTFELGFDTSFDQNRYNFNFTYYNRHTMDKFADITLPSHSGISSFRSNNGEIQNQGVEMEIGVKLADSKNFKWNVNLNAAYNINKIISLPDNGLENNRQNAVQAYGPDGELVWVGGYQEGQRPGDVYAFKALGLYETEADIPDNFIDKSTGNNGSNNRFLYGKSSWAAVYNAGTQGTGLPLQPGDVKFQDVNDDGILDNYDIVKIGNRTPKWTGGLTTTLSYKNISLYVRTDFALGHVVTDSKTPWIMGNMQGTYNTIELVKETWTETNTAAKYPTYVWADQLGKRNYARNSSMFIYKGDYLAFREVSLSYRLPSSLSQKMKMSALDFSVIGQNLGYLTAAKNIYSPEYGADGWGGYPLPRTLILSLKLTF